MTIAEMSRFLVSFGGEYKHTAHPVLGYWPELGDDAVLEVWAYTEKEAREYTFATIGKHWAFLYTPEREPGWNYKNLGLLADEVAEPRPFDWTVGCSVTVDYEGRLVLNLEDLTVDLLAADAPRSLVKLIEERQEFWKPTVGWQKRD